MPGIFIIVISLVLFPAALTLFNSFTLLFPAKASEEWEKVRQTCVLLADFREFWRTKADGFLGRRDWY